MFSLFCHAQDRSYCFPTQNILKEARIPAALDASPHKLRHAFGTYQIAAGVDLATVKDAMGHADFRTTSLYVKALDSRKRLITSTGEATIQRLRDSVKQDDNQANKDPH